MNYLLFFSFHDEMPTHICDAVVHHHDIERHSMVQGAALLHCIVEMMKERRKKAVKRRSGKKYSQSGPANGHFHKDIKVNERSRYAFYTRFKLLALHSWSACRQLLQLLCCGSVHCKCNASNRIVHKVALHCIHYTLVGVLKSLDVITLSTT